MKTALLLSGLLLVLVGPLAALDSPPDRDPGYVLIEGQATAFRLTLPDGWAMAGDAHWKPGAAQVFHPLDQAYGDAFAYIYTGSIPKDDVGPQGLPAYLQKQNAIRMETHPYDSVVDMDGVKTKRGPVAKLVELRGPGYDQLQYHHLVASLDAGAALVWFELAVVDDVQFERALPAFRQLIASYRYLAPTGQDVTPPWSKSLQFWITPNARQQADLDTETTQGRRYKTQVLPDLQDLLTEALSDTTNARAKTEPYELVVEVGGDGTVQRFWAEPKNDATLCLVDALKTYVFDEPPMAPFHLHLQNPGPTPTPPPADIKTDD